MKIPEKERLFNRCYYGEMDKQELTGLVKRLLLDKELREYSICSGIRWSI